MNTICYVAGHSGGHIIPSLTHAQQMLTKKQADTVLFFSTTAPLDTKIVAKHPVISKLVLLPVRGIPSKKFLIPLFFLQLIGAFFMSMYHLLRTRPRAIVSTGGFVSLPVCLAGWLLRIPLELYELNVEPGKSVHFLARLATNIWILYPETASYLPAHKCLLTEYPVRFSQATRQINRDQALTSLQFSPSRKTLFIIGGSQGSLFLNTLVRAWITKNVNHLQLIQVIHQTGEHDQTDWKNFYKQHGIPAITFAYHEHLETFYQAADLVISRAGAGTLAELAFFQKKSLIIPLETSNTSHQTHNALAHARKNPELFCVMEQKNIELILTQMNQLLELY